MANTNKKTSPTTWAIGLLGGIAGVLIVASGGNLRIVQGGRP